MLAAGTYDLEIFNGFNEARPGRAGSSRSLPARDRRSGRASMRPAPVGRDHAQLSVLETEHNQTASMRPAPVGRDHCSSRQGTRRRFNEARPGRAGSYAGDPHRDASV